MSTFKDMLAADIDRVILNQDEFAEEHRIEGKTIICVVGTDNRLELSGGNKLSVSRSSITVYAKVADLPHRKNEGDSLNVDGREYIVDSWAEALGMATISLSQTRS